MRNSVVFFLCGRSAAINPGNTLYVTGLSTRVSEKDVERHFSKEGKVLLVYCFLFILNLLVLQHFTKTWFNDKLFSFIIRFCFSFSGSFMLSCYGT